MSSWLHKTRLRSASSLDSVEEKVEDREDKISVIKNRSFYFSSYTSPQSGAGQRGDNGKLPFTVLSSHFPSSVFLVSSPSHHPPICFSLPLLFPVFSIPTEIQLGLVIWNIKSMVTY